MIKRLATLARSAMGDPYVLGMAGLALLARSLKGIRVHAQQVAGEVAKLEAVAAQGLHRSVEMAAAAATHQQEILDTVEAMRHAERDWSPAKPVDVAGEHEDLHP